MRPWLILALSIASTSAFAQAPNAPQTPVAITLLQNMVGQLAGENAQLAEQNQALQQEAIRLRQDVADAQKKAAEAKPAEPAK